LWAKSEVGFAMGCKMNYAGYLSVAVVAFFTAWIAGNNGSQTLSILLGNWICIHWINWKASFLMKDTNISCSIGKQGNKYNARN
jgi:hypothetical protein